MDIYNDDYLKVNVNGGCQTFSIVMGTLVLGLIPIFVINIFMLFYPRGKRMV